MNSHTDRRNQPGSFDPVGFTFVPPRRFENLRVGDHGEWGFRAYTNARGVLYHGAQTDPDLRYPPYGSQKKLRELVAS